ncbi:MAG: hypothetical protein RI967_609 [Planctomycetota bacterium]
MKNPPTPSHDDTLLAIAERRSGQFRTLLVKRNGRPRVIEAASFAETDLGGLGAWLAKHACRDLRVVLPAASTIVRIVSMPTGPEAQMLAALRLQAEGIFLGSVPACRMGLAILGDAGASERQGCIMAWPESQVGIALPQSLDAIATFVPETAAMLALATPDLPAVSANRADGSIAIVMQSAGGLVVRATREAAAEDDGSWREDLRRAIVETALNAGVPASEVARIAADAERSARRIGDTVLVIDPALRTRLERSITIPDGLGADPAWIEENAILLGAAIASTGPQAEGFRLRRREERDAPNALSRILQRYSQPSRALRVALAAYLLIAVGPIAISWLRLKVVEWKLPSDAATFEKTQRAVEQRISHYSALSKRAVPMLKLLGDLACCTPDGIEIESVQLSATQGVTVRGVAKAQGEDSAAEIISSMARLMDSSGVFDKTNWRFAVPDRPGNFKFDLSAGLSQPSAMPEYPEERDWSVKTLAQRKYPSTGDEADGGAPAAGAAERTTSGGSNAVAASGGEADAGDASSAAGSDATTVASAGAGSSRGGTGGSATSASRGIGRRAPTGGEGATEADAGSKPAQGVGAGAGGTAGPAGASQSVAPVPDAISEERLMAMSKDELNSELAALAKARRRLDLDEETKKRVLGDFNRILSRLKELSAS